VEQRVQAPSEGQAAALAATALTEYDFSVRNMRIPLCKRAEMLIVGRTIPGIREMSVLTDRVNRRQFRFSALAPRDTNPFSLKGKPTNANLSLQRLKPAFRAGAGRVKGYPG
jgi:hypothetical protein